MSDCSSPLWKELYVAAILEIDQAKILGRIRDAKMAICDRVEEPAEKGTSGERGALNRANRALSELQEVHVAIAYESRTRRSAAKLTTEANEKAA